MAITRKGDVELRLPSGFTIIKKVGEGARSVVWSVSDESTRRKLALKIATEPDPGRRLEREFAILDRLEHPGIVKVERFGEHEGLEYFTMELVKGRPFTVFMDRHRTESFFLELFLSVLRKAAAILSSLHRQGIVHADLKPANLLIRDNGEPVLLDFGFAEDYAFSPSIEPRGTLDYVAPELFKGEAVSPAADIYSLGAMAYQGLSGKCLGCKKPLRELIATKLKTPPKMDRKKLEVPSEVEELVLWMLNPESALRPSAEEIITAIEVLEGTETARGQLEQPDSVPKLCFGGREEETEQIESLVFDQKVVVLLEGAEGMGKTRLLRELRFRTLIGERNALLVEGRGGHLSLIEHIQAALDLADEEAAREKEHRYERIFQAIWRKELDAVMIDAPGNLSPDEEECLGFLARGLDGKLGLILAGVKERVYPKASRIELAALDEGKILKLVTKTFEGLRESDKLTAALASVGEGNPGRMGELLEILYQEGWLYRKKRWVYEPRGKERSLEEKLEGWLGEKIQGLNKESKLVISILALSESSVPSEVLQKVTGDSQLILMGLVNERLARSLVYRQRTHYETQNDLVRRYTLAGITRNEEKSLTKKLARALESLCREIWSDDPASWDSSYLVQLASLYFKASVASRARRYLLPAAKRLSALYDFNRSRRLLAYLQDSEPLPEERKKALCELGRIASIERNASQADELYTQALPLVGAKPEGKADILMRIGLAYQSVRELDKASDFFHRSEECLEGVPSGLKPRLLAARAWNAYYQGALDIAQELFEQALDTATSPYDRHNIRYGIAWTLLGKRNPSQALKHAHKALQASNAEQNKGDMARTALLLVDILRNLGKLKDAESYVEQALALSREMEYPILTAEALRQKAYLLSRSGRHREAGSVATQAIEALGKLNDEYRIAFLRLCQAQRSKDLGDWGTARSIYRSLWQGFHKTTDVSPLTAYILEGWSEPYRLQGNFLIAERMLKKAQRLAKSRKDETILLWIQMKLCRLHVLTENQNEARKLLGKCRALLDRESDVHASLNLDLVETEVLLGEGENARALQSASMLTKKTEELGFEDIRGDALRIWGRALISSGKLDEGLAKLHKSLEVFKSHEELYEQGATLFTIAQVMFNKTGYSEDALSALEEAQIIFERVEAERDIELIKGFKAGHFADWRKQDGLPHEYLEALKHLSELINYRLGEENFMLDLLETVLELTGAQRGMVFLMDENELYSVASKRIDTTTTRDARRISQTVIRRIQQGLKPIYTPNATKDKRFNRSRSILLNDIRSLMCIPLRTTEKLIGTIYLDSQEIGLFDAEKTLYFEALGNLLAATIDKSVEFGRLREELVLARKRRSLEKAGIVIGTSPAMGNLCTQLEQIAACDTNILLEGETGTGKGVFAHMIHEQSSRKEREFCSINCGVLPENIFEWELFGYRKGTFTGATEDRIGLLEAADGSTVFFDEISNISLAMQAKLLEVIEERVIRRFGETKKHRVNLRFIFATNRDLKEEVREGRFREDLYFRIGTVALELPPLRERREDIPEFIDFFLKKFSKELNKNVTETSDEIMQALLDYPWPGNIRELKNVIERAILLARGRRITPNLLDQRFFPIVPHTTQTLDEAKKIEEQELIRRTLAETRGNVTRSAQRLGISRQHLSRLLKRYGIPRKPN